MDLKRAIAFILVILVAATQASYFTPHMIFTRKSPAEKIIFSLGIILLVFLTLKFASGFFDLLFGAFGIAAVSLIFLKQGVSEKGVLISARGKEFFPWDKIGGVKIYGEKTVSLAWLDFDGSELFVQKYSENRLPALLERINEHNIKLAA